MLASEIKSHYRAVRRRLWGAALQQPVVAGIKPPEKPQKPVATPVYRRPKKPPKPVATLVYGAPVGPGMGMAFPIRTQADIARNILAEEAARYRVRVIDVLSERRDRRSVLARHAVCWRLRHETTWSLPHIGRFVRRDHTTAIHAVRRHQQRIDAGEAVQ